MLVFSVGFLLVLLRRVGIQSNYVTGCSKHALVGSCGTTSSCMVMWCCNSTTRTLCLIENLFFCRGVILKDCGVCSSINCCFNYSCSLLCWASDFHTFIFTFPRPHKGEKRSQILFMQIEKTQQMPHSCEIASN